MMVIKTLKYVFVMNKGNFLFLQTDPAHHEFCGIFEPHPGRGRRHRLHGPQLHDAHQSAARQPDTDPLRSHSALLRPHRPALRVKGHVQQRRVGAGASPHARTLDRVPASPHTDPVHHRHLCHHHDARAEARISRLRVR